MTSRSWFAPKKLTPETLVKRDIKQYLGMKGFFNFHVIQGMGSFPGVPDIIGQKKMPLPCPHCGSNVIAGVTLYVEAKAPKGRQSVPQENFQRMIELHGGRYILCRSVEDLIREGY